MSTAGTIQETMPMVESRKKMKALAYDMVAKIFKPMVTSIIGLKMHDTIC
jgi:hypothetical protein